MADQELDASDELWMEAPVHVRMLAQRVREERDEAECDLDVAPGGLVLHAARALASWIIDPRS
jgi:hypothetical protein